ncbi:S-adenosyl-L-methionine-dependent methyltransferase [Boeremia exigua]|uniref:S-adenosyl-L-methionine-dependent methyltransferase n=1 Tax=Boeremia exigua TaxID=749465 RepID=UPI001E8D2ED3|nr:S-adenosyl-L-methionine-dependent methyltransferase [Boeremia exigua]KAH6625700.1 S-adenosyl-L-methionine-dependent methyltransferase [Boeremia exigua]
MTLTEDILNLASRGPTGLDEPERLALLQATEKLTVALENPLEKFIRLFLTLYDPIVIRLAVDLKLVDITLAHNSPITAAELAEKSNADVELIRRILRMLITIDIFTATADSPPQYSVLPFGHALATGSPLRSAVLHISHCFPATAAMPDYYAANGYKNPSDARHSPFSFAYQCPGETYFDFLGRPENAAMSSAFNETMAMQKTGEDETFVSAYPVAERLQNQDPERVLFVDVGGGVGHQLAKFRKRAGGLKGRFALEDLPAALAQASDLPEDVVKVGHDFFLPQPDTVKGAKAFYLRTILHDWPQMQAETILKHIVDVMAEDSVVLINELILPETGVGHFEAKMDWHLMNLAALERTEEQWRVLVGGVGLEVQAIWWEEDGTKGRRALIECRLKR